MHAGEPFLAGEAALHGEGEAAFALVIEEIDQLRADFEHEAELTKAEADSTYASARTLVLVLIAIAIVTGFAVAGYLAWTISKGVSRISTALSPPEYGGNPCPALSASTMATAAAPPWASARINCASAYRAMGMGVESARYFI